MSKKILYLKRDNTIDFGDANCYSEFKDSYIAFVKEIIEKRKKEKVTQIDIAYLACVNRKRVIKFEKIERIDMELLYFLANKFKVKIINT